MRQLTPEERKREIDFVSDTMKWPLWPQLPVKRPGRGFNGWPQIGHVQDDDTSHIEETRPRLPIQVHVQHEEDMLRTVEVLEYATVEAMIDDGWMVD